MNHQTAPTWETLSVPLELDAVNEAEGTFKGWASVFGSRVDAWIPSVIHPGAFAKTLKERSRKVKILWQHSMEDPIGLPTLMEERSKGLYVEGKLTLTERIREYLMLMRDGVVDGLSIGFDPIKFDFSQDGNETMRHLREVRLWEFSPVTFGADPNAMINEVHAAMSYQQLPVAERTYPWDPVAAERRVRAWAATEPAATECYRRAFLWHDPDEDWTHGHASTLLIADIVDGILTAIPRGIFAASHALQGQRGRLTISDADQARCRTHLSRYYAVMRQQFEDDALVAPWDVEADSLVISLDTLIADPPLVQWAMRRLQSTETLTPAELERVQAAQALWSEARTVIEARVMTPLASRDEPSGETAIPPETPGEPDDNAKALSRIAEMEAMAAAYTVKV